MDWTYTKDNKPQNNDICLCKLNDKYDGKYIILKFDSSSSIYQPHWHGIEENHRTTHHLNNVECWVVITDDAVSKTNKKRKENVQKELERMQDCVFNMQKSINTLVSWKDALK